MQYRVIYSMITRQKEGIRTWYTAYKISNQGFQVHKEKAQTNKGRRHKKRKKISNKRVGESKKKKKENSRSRIGRKLKKHPER